MTTATARKAPATIELAAADLNPQGCVFFHSPKAAMQL